MLAVGVDRGFPSAGTFLWRRFKFRREVLTSREHARGRPPQVGRDASHLRHNNCQRPYRLAEQRLHTDRTNLDVAILLQTPMSETAHYTDAERLCQANTALSGVLVWVSLCSLCVLRVSCGFFASDY